jgi:hypothetical protein
MRRWRSVAAAVALAALVLPVVARPAGGQTYLGLHDVTCAGATTEGTGLPAQTRLEVALVDPASQRTLSSGRPTTDAAGAFEWHSRVSLSGMRKVRAVINRPGQATPLAWVEQSLPSACPLAYTGPSRALPLVGVGLSSFTLGILVLLAMAYRGRHVAIPGRHLAAPYGGRHARPR